MFYSRIHYADQKLIKVFKKSILASSIITYSTEWKGINASECKSPCISLILPYFICPSQDPIITLLQWLHSQSQRASMQAIHISLC